MKYLLTLILCFVFASDAFALGGLTNATGITATPGSGGGGSGTVTSVAVGNGLTGGPITTTGTINLSVPDVTKTISYQLTANDMAGQVNYNGSSITATIPAISGTIFASGMTSLITNYNSSALTISSTPTINNYPGTSIGQYGWLSLTSNGTSLDGFGFPGFGTITSNSLVKFTGTSGITTASTATDNGTTFAVGSGFSVDVATGAITVASCTGCGASGGTVTLGTSIAATNPQRSGEATTGLYSAATGEIDGAVVTTGQIFKWNATALNLIAGSYQLAGINALRFPLDTTTGGSIAIGSSSLAAQATSQANLNTSIGYQALQAFNGANATKTVAIGYGALTAATNGVVSTESVVIGYNAGAAITTGYQNVIIGGEAALTGNGNTNVIIGFSAGAGGGTGNIVAGRSSCNAGIGSNNVCIGTGNGTNFQQSSSVLIGQGANVFNASSTTFTEVGFGTKAGTGDTFFGYLAGAATAANANNSVGVGHQSLNALTTGPANTAVGYQTGLVLTTGNNNTILGNSVASTVLTIGSNNILLGVNNAVTTIGSSTSNTIQIGGTAGAWVNVTGTGTLATEATTLRGTLAISDLASDVTHTDSTVCQDTTTHILYSGSGTLGICLGTSSARYKKDIKPQVDGLAQVMALKPVNFYYKKGFGDNGDKRQYGFIAEDMVSVLPGLTGLDKDKKPNSVDLVGVIPVLVKAIQQQQDMIERLASSQGCHTVLDKMVCVK